jgi:putative lipoic acid-binding regulatory protein
LIEDICREEGIPFELRRISRDEVRQADELLLSSATKEVLPITTLDGAASRHGANRGRPGPIYQRLYEGYQRARPRSASEETSHGTAPEIPPEQSLIEYPVPLPIKVMGANTPSSWPWCTSPGPSSPAFDESSVEQRPSKAGNYLGLTLTIHVTSSEQLDELYRTLTTPPAGEVRAVSVFYVFADVPAAC